MPGRSLIILNPNSSDIVTAAIDRAVAPLRAAGVPLRCVTSQDGPKAIENQRDGDLSIGPMLALAARLEPEALGFVIACYSDPGLHALRDQTRLPVTGIQRASVAMAMSIADRFGVIAILDSSVRRQRRSFAAMGVTSMWCGSRALGLGVADLADPNKTAARLIEVGCRLRDEDGAEVLILGCAGMADYRDFVASETGLPVVEPSQAAVSVMIGQRLSAGAAPRPS
ncbi:aspartate/glutamate racemase family protein [Palleronia sp. KMU-117]|uniref:aspartate/glutamate racemase family protein n=1 Tax=Palleronia sp. KMU-117 TaxID=3434108 RepID=UPI003D70B497